MKPIRAIAAVLATSTLLLAAAPAPAAPMGLSGREGECLFQVWAPNARSVEVIGDFNGWSARADQRLQPDLATGIWSVKLNRSPPRGAYQYLINGELHRRDPYARAVSADGRNSVYADPAAFNWEGDRKVKVALEDLVIYEMHVGTFNDPDPKDGKPATFYDAIKRLDLLKGLGINCVELLPVHEFNGMHSWGYNPCDIFAVEQTYGGPDGLKTFVKACHARGIAVHLDIVHNHYGRENLDILQFDGTGSPADGGIYFYEGPGIGQTPWGPRVKFSDAQVRRFVTDNAFMWIEEYRVDGFRWDSTINIRAHSQGAVPIPEGLRMLEDINTAIRARAPDAISIAEDSLDIGNFHGSWDYDFHHTVMPVLLAVDGARDVPTLANALTARPTTMQRVIYVDNHDEAGKINGQQRIASDFDSANPDSDQARRLCGLGALLTFTAPGTPLLFMGNEMQEGGTFHDDLPLNWSNLKRHAGLVLLHRDLIRLRRNLDGVGDALKGLEIEVPMADNAARTLVYWRWHERDPGTKWVIAVNLFSEPVAQASVPFPDEGPWKTVLDTEWKRYGGEAGAENEKPFTLDPATKKAPMALPPFSARIFAPSRAPSAAAPVKIAGPAAAQAAPAKPAFSMYGAMRLPGSFNQWNAAAAPMKLVADGTWEYYTEFDNAADIELKLAANEDGKISWGAGDTPELAAPGAVVLARLGGPLRVKGPMNGAYLFTFKEENRTLSVAASAPRAKNPDAGKDLRREFRIWTGSTGSRIEARLVAATSEAVMLEDKTGRRFQTKLSSLAAPDQELIREFMRRENAP